MDSRTRDAGSMAVHPSGLSPVASRDNIADTAPAAIKALPHYAAPRYRVKLPAPAQSVAQAYAMLLRCVSKKNLLQRRVILDNRFG